MVRRALRCAGCFQNLDIQSLVPEEAFLARRHTRKIVDGVHHGYCDLLGA
jgi:hypothetical protein